MRPSPDFGLAEAALGDLPAAVAAETSAIEIDQKSSLAYYNRGYFLSRMGEKSAAAADYAAAIEASASFDPKARRASLFEPPDEATIDIVRSVEIDPRLGHAHLHRGEILFELADYRNAIDEFSAILALNPLFSAAYDYRGRSYAKIGDLDHAIGDFGALTGLRGAYGHLLRGFAYAQKGDLDRAIADYDRSALLAPNAEVFRARASVYFKKTDFSHAILDASSALAKDPKDLDALFIRGAAKLENGDYSGAIEDLNAVLAVNPKNAVGFFQRAWAYERLGRRKEALADYRAAHDLDRAHKGAAEGIERLRRLR